MRILIAEHHPDHRRSLRLILEVEGYGVVEAPDGAAALRLLERETVDAVISDILLPHLDGFRLCHEIRSNPRWRELPFVFYPATYATHDAGTDEPFARKVGGDVFLLRPAPPAAIVAALQTAMRTTGRAPPGIALNTGSGRLEEYCVRLVARLEAKNLELARLNDELAESRARFEGIVISALDAIIMVDDAEQIVLFNGSAEKMFGRSAATVLGQSFTQLLPHRYHGEPGSHLRILVEPGTMARRWTNPELASGESPTEEEFPIEASISQLAVADRSLSTVILRDITRRQRMSRKLEFAAQRYRTLAARVETIREQERTSISRDIHDVLAQDLTRLKIDLVWLGRRLARPVAEELRPALAERIKDATSQADAAITHVQRIATNLRPVILDTLGLPAAVEWQVEDFARRTGLACHATAPTGNSPLAGDRATALFRILQECLTNIARHAHASSVEVNLSVLADEVTLTVHDNGRGITAAEIDDPRSIGLVGMSERAQAFGGALQITGKPDAGTTVSVRVAVNGSVPPFPS